MGGKVNLANNVVGQGMVQAGVGPVWMTRASGALKMRGFVQAITRNGVGDYTVTMDTPYPADELHITAYIVANQFTPANGPHIVGVTSIIPSLSTGPLIRILIKDSANNPAAVDVSFAVKVELQEIAN
jgi:hypothetical protein